jgi:hypothetical protein
MTSLLQTVDHIAMTAINAVLLAALPLSVVMFAAQSI